MTTIFFDQGQESPDLEFAFPVIYDDISDTKRGKQYMDQIVRSYWDNWWEAGLNHSQLIITQTNVLKDNSKDDERSRYGCTI